MLGLFLRDDPGLPVAFSEYKSPAEMLRIIQYKAPDFDVSVFDRDLISAHTGLSKYIFTSNETDEFYVLDNDPGEENNLCNKNPCPADHPLRGVIQTWMDETPAYELREDADSISEQKDKEALEKLRSLGYIQ